MDALAMYSSPFEVKKEICEEAYQEPARHSDAFDDNVTGTDKLFSRATGVFSTHVGSQPTNPGVSQNNYRQCLSDRIAWSQPCEQSQLDSLSCNVKGEYLSEPESKHVGGDSDQRNIKHQYDTLQTALLSVVKIERTDGADLVTTSDEESEMEDEMMEYTEVTICKPDIEHEYMHYDIEKGLVKQEITIYQSEIENASRNCENENKPKSVDRIKNTKNYCHMSPVSEEASRGRSGAQKDRDGLFKCQQCSATYRHRPSLKRHVNKHHQGLHDVQTSCSDNQNPLIISNGIFRKHKNHHRTARHECKLCRKIFLHEEKLKHHMERYHKVKLNKPVFKCEKCSKVFAKKISLEQHFQVHTCTQQHSCKYCSARFSTEDDLQRHITSHSHTGKKPFKCTECKWTFPSQNGLNLHMKLHSAQTCTDSGKSHNNQGECHFASHVATKGNKSEQKQNYKANIYPCTICKSGFRTQFNYQRHMKTHEFQRDTHGQPSFPCSECSEVFATNGNRIRHRRRAHPTEQDRKFPCDTCTKAFSHRYRLTAHIRTVHLGQRPYPCSKCTMSFHKKGCLQRHVEKMHVT